MRNTAEKGMDNTGFQIDIYSYGGVLKTMFLASKNNGIFRFEYDETALEHQEVSFENKDGDWRIICSEKARFMDGEKGSWRKIRDDCQFYLEAGSKQIVIFLRKRQIEDYVYRRVAMGYGGRISIGRSFSCDIEIISPLASRQHAELLWSGSEFEIRDTGSANGVFVNGRKVQQARLKTGDTIYIAGTDMVVGSGFLSINFGSSGTPDVLLNGSSLVPYREPAFNRKKEHQSSNPPEIYLNRFPRSRLAFPKREILISEPPFSMDDRKIPMILQMGGSMVMGGSAAMMGNYTMLLSSVLFPVLTRKYTDKQKADYEKMRVEKYTQYLRNKDMEIREELRAEEYILNNNYPDLTSVLRYTWPEQRNRLWTHKNTDDDFLSIRIGCGPIPMKATLNSPKENFSLTEDPLVDQMRKLASTPFMIQNSPVLLDLIKDRVCSFTGSSEICLKMMELILSRASILYSYDELKLVFILQPSTLEKLEIIRYLPHVWNEDFTERRIASDSIECFQISTHLNGIVEERIREKEWMKDNKRVERYLILSDNKKLLDEIEVLKKVMPNSRDLGISVLTFFDEIPKDASLLIELRENEPCSIDYLADLETESLQFTMDQFSVNEATASMQNLFSCRLRSVAEKNGLPSSLDFLAMYNVLNIETLNPLHRWKESNPISSLAAPIGVNPDGSLFYLDLHQKFQGPHGLVAGTTGSGKSEFLITYILSMALNYHPDEVQFVLIDYKGGGLAGAFSNPDKGIFLPHLVGTITNLDGATITRSIICIESELKRRQIIFNEAKTALDEGTMDIHLYQKLYRAGKVKKPVSHLFIVSDEFAELKQQEPEFMEKLISAARIGRSLGVHLILATQKPAGVVNDQILSNTKFRVCLKVQDAMDSKDMLNDRPDAAEIKEAGRFYLQVGYNEFFALGQSAWSGAEYVPDVKAIDPAEQTIQFIDNSGRVTHSARIPVQKTKSEQTQLVALVKYLSQIAAENDIHPTPLWDEPLPTEIDLEEQMEKYPGEKSKTKMEVVVGLIDDPGKQMQYPYVIDLLRTQNILITGQVGSGRSTIAQSILLEACMQYSPDELHVYGADFEGNSLSQFKGLPHVGSIIDNESIETTFAFFDLIQDLTEKRKRAIQAAGAEDYLSARQVIDMPFILVVLENAAGLSSTREGELFLLRMAEYLKGGFKNGICFILTAGRTAEINTKIKNEFFERIALQHKEYYEYTETLSVRVPGEIGHNPGRGYLLYKGRPLETQFARYKPEANGLDRPIAIRNLIQKLKDRYPGKYRIEKIPEIPKEQEYREFFELFQGDKLPLGYHLKDCKPIAIPYKQFSMMTLYFGGDKARRAVLENVIYALQKREGDLRIFKQPAGSSMDAILSDYPQDSYTAYETSSGDITRFILFIAEELQRRKKIHDDYCAERGIKGYDTSTDSSYYYMRQATKPLIVFFEDFNKVCETASTDEQSLFKAMFIGASWWNVTIVGCMYPETMGSGLGTTMFQAFNPDKTVLLIGGDFKKQTLVSTDLDAGKYEKDAIANLVYMYYRKKPYYLMLPVGTLGDREENEDDQPIFG